MYKYMYVSALHAGTRSIQDKQLFNWQVCAYVCMSNWIKSIHIIQESYCFKKFLIVYCTQTLSNVILVGTYWPLSLDFTETSVTALKGVPERRTLVTQLFLRK